MKWAIPADTLLKCQSGTLPPPPFTELNISLCQNKLGDPQIFFLSPDFNAMSAGNEREREKEGGSVKRQFSSVHMKALWHTTRLNTDIGNSYSLIGEAVAAATTYHRPSHFPKATANFSSFKRSTRSFRSKYLFLIKRHTCKRVTTLFTSVLTFVIASSLCP